MFTGIVTVIGYIKTVTPIGTPQTGVRLHIDSGTLDMQDVQQGDSIAIQGACMTVVAHGQQYFDVEVSQESLRLTQGLTGPGLANLEKALRLSDRLGGHLVSGHVDGCGTVSHFSQVGESWDLRIQAPLALAKYFAYKGSVVVNGVSLTVNRVIDDKTCCEFFINLIPHTIANTTLQFLQIGDSVNLEIDLIARYVERMLSVDHAMQT